MSVELWKDSVIALLAAAGLAALAYLALRAVFGRSRELCAPVYLVLPAGERTGEIEQSVGELQRLRRSYGGAARAVVLDCGMDEEQRRMMRILQREDPLLLLAREDELRKELRRSAQGLREEET